MNRALVSCLVTASLLASTCPAFAAGTAPTPPPIISALDKGQVAPYTGVLLSPPAVAQIVAEKDAVAVTVQLAAQHQLDLDRAELTFQLAQQASTCTADKSILQAQLTDVQKQNQVIEQQLRQASGGLSTPVWVGIGVAGGIAVTLLTLAVSKL